MTLPNRTNNSRNFVLNTNFNIPINWRKERTEQNTTNCSRTANTLEDGQQSKVYSQQPILNSQEIQKQRENIAKRVIQELNDRGLILQRRKSRRARGQYAQSLKSIRKQENFLNWHKNIRRSSQEATIVYCGPSTSSTTIMTEALKQRFGGYTGLPDRANLGKHKPWPKDQLSIGKTPGSGGTTTPKKIASSLTTAMDNGR
ncbi:uncharacterized protein DEA37_0002769 [Paragonimus westermani]|uniref:Uncharacterized protein n=1 Tax=Paragonimus westermani TaxID=34504 RepID=A0A5J4N3J8_9TREM|nr:uncharacterized protein DEA37_0002769 [Paragonimus westermani]